MRDPRGTASANTDLRCLAHGRTQTASRSSNSRYYTLSQRKIRFTSTRNPAKQWHARFALAYIISLLFCQFETSM